MNRKSKVFLIFVLSLFFLSGVVFAEYSNDVPTPTVVTPPKASTPPPAPKEPKGPPIKITVPQIPDTYETTTPTLAGANVIARVLESGTKKAISGATVKWYGAKYATGGITDSRGEARIGQVTLGEAKITASARGYVSNSKTVRVKSSTRVQYFDIYLNKTAGIAPSSEMPPTPMVTPKKPESEGKAAVSGTVYDKATRQPISGAAVKAYNAGYRQDLIKDVKTDRSGRYTIDNCPLDAAIKIVYGKSGYTLQDIPRYIPKVATVYTQDVYLERGKVETKKPKEDEGSGEKRGDIGTTQRALEEERINVGIVSAKLGETELAGDYIQLPYGWWPLYIKYRNLGPANARDVRPTYVITDYTSFTERSDVIEQKLLLRRNEDEKCHKMLYFHPGLHDIYVEACGWTFYTDSPQTETDYSDNSREAVVYFYDSGNEGADLDIELSRFDIDGVPVSSQPTLDIGDGEHIINVQFINYGPQQATGPTSVTVVKDYDEVIYSDEIPASEINEIESIGIPYHFAPGRYHLYCRLLRNESDFDIRDNEENSNVKTHGYVTFTGELPITREMLDTIERLRPVLERRLEGTVITPQDEPAESEPAESESAESEPTAQPPQHLWTEFEVKSFTVEGQPVENNPTMGVGDGRLLLKIAIKNNGPDEPDRAANVYIRKNGRDADLRHEYISTERPAELELLMSPFEVGQCRLEVFVEPPPGHLDSNMVNNTKGGTLTLTRGPSPSGRESHQTEIGLVGFNVEGQPITDNPVIQIADNQPVSLSFTAINNGPDDANDSCTINLSGVGLSGSQEIDLRRRVNVLMGNSTQRNFAFGSYNFTATIDPAAGDEDSDRSNNTISGMVSFVPAAAAAAGPGGQPPQPGGGQPGGAQPGGGPGGRRGGGPGIAPVIQPQPDAGLLGGGAPQAMPAPVSIAEAPLTEAAQPYPIVHPEMGRGPEVEVAGQVIENSEKIQEAAREEALPAGKEKKHMLWLIALLSGVGLFIIFAVIARKKKKKNEV